ncbi:MAG TPA: ROK family protein [Cyclobacteriaceae bacterium]|nr:ROK family protein [Cyclobacteriaceae bacterium]
MSNKEHLWGIDLGGTKAEGVVLGPGRLEDILFRDRLPTGAENGYDFILNQIKILVSMMEKQLGYRPERLGIGTPGTLDPGLGVMKGCNSECMNGTHMKEDLEALLQLQIEIANDANCFALAETRMGVVKQQFPGAKVVYGVIMGTGVGGGLVINNHVINGLQGIAGEWGHNFLDESAGPCYCGKSGCVEKVLSGPDLERYYRSLTGNKVIMKDIYARYKAGGDEAAVKTINRLTHFFGLATSVLINILDPDVIVIGGGVGNIDEIYTDGVESLKKYIFNHRLDTPIVKPLLGDSAGVFGAAYLVD